VVGALIGDGVRASRRTLLRCALPGEGFGLAWGAAVGRLAGMSMDHELQKHYALLLGIGSPWEVKTVELKLAEKSVEIELGWQWGSAAKCPECGRECSIHDSAPWSEGWNGGNWTNSSIWAWMRRASNGDTPISRS
jgi:hypothetical protein